jgi:collagen type I/II/III/V/XI/XXIV/XXVII alpha
MPTVTVAGGGSSGTLTFTSGDSAPYANTLALALNAGLGNGTLTALTYSSGPVAPGAPNGVVFFGNAPTILVTIPTEDLGTVVQAGPVSLTGGAAGETVLAGSAGLTYIDITPSGNAIDYIVAGDGTNVITTATTGTGNYQINTGSGADTISVFGNGVISAGTGLNDVSVSGGSSLIYSEGQDNIVTNGFGSDTVMIGTGQATINPGSTNLVIMQGTVSPKTLFLAPGTGSDIVSVTGGGTVYGGTGGDNVLIADAASGVKTMLVGGGNGDQLFATGGGSVVLVAGVGSETLSGASGTFSGVTLSASTADDIFQAGSGNDVILGGSGNDTVVFSGLRADYALSVEPNGTLVVTGIDGGMSAVDMLSGIETLSFADQTIQAPCFAQNTHILTSSGEVLVQDLRVGDILMTGNGGAPQAIRWIGSRSVDCHRHPEPQKVLPIRVAAHAFGDGCPHRDLFLSPDHAVLAEGVLIPIKHLVNGTTVHSVAARSLTYYHVELERHDAILAEGLACESYLDTGDRSAFEGGSATALHPRWGSEARDVTLIMDVMGCAPLRVEGREVEMTRAKLRLYDEALAIAV